MDASTLTFNRVTVQSIIEDLHGKKITVIVPAAALYSDDELTAQNEPTMFMDNAPIRSKSSMGNEVTYTGTSASIVDNEINNNSSNNKTTVRLSLSVVIDLYHKQFSIYIPKHNNDLIKLVDFINDILNRLENSSDGRANEMFEYIDEFYKVVIKNQKSNISKKLSLDAMYLPDMKPVVGFTSNTLEEDAINTATFIDIDSITV